VRTVAYAHSNVGHEGVYVRAEANVPANTSERTSHVDTEEKEGATGDPLAGVPLIENSCKKPGVAGE
jgi:hypothetical protein